MAAKSSLRTALTTGRIVFSTEGDYSKATIAALQATDNSVRWVLDDMTSQEPTTVSRDVTPAGVFVAAAYSKSGNCFFLYDDPPNDTGFGQLSGAPSVCYAANGLPGVPGGVNYSPSW